MKKAIRPAFIAPVILMVLMSACTPAATPLPGPEALLPQLGPVCDDVFSTSGGNIPDTPPVGSITTESVLVLQQAEGQELWEMQVPSIAPLASSAAKDVRNLVCIKKELVQIDTYTDGAPAYQRKWNVLLIHLVEGNPTPVSRTVLKGSGPPVSKVGGGPGFGDEPVDDFRRWLSNGYAGDKTILKHDDVRTVAFSPDGKVLASNSKKSIKIWEVASGQLLHSLATEDENGIAFSPDGKTLASISDFEITLWDVETGGKNLSRRSITPLSYGIAFSPDGRILAAGGRTSSNSKVVVTLWEAVDTGNDQRKFKREGPVTTKSIAFSPDGKTLASMDSSAIILWDVATGTELHYIENFSGPNYSSMAFSPDGKAIASSADASIKLWDTATGRELLSINTEGEITSVAFSPNGKVLASGSRGEDQESLANDDTLKLWDVATGQELRSLKYSLRVTSVAFSPDGKILASAGYDNSVRLWDVVTGP